MRGAIKLKGADCPGGASRAVHALMRTGPMTAAGSVGKRRETCLAAVRLSVSDGPRQAASWRAAGVLFSRRLADLSRQRLDLTRRDLGDFPRSERAEDERAVPSAHEPTHIEAQVAPHVAHLRGPKGLSAHGARPGGPAPRGAARRPPRPPARLMLLPFGQLHLKDPTRPERACHDRSVPARAGAVVRTSYENPAAHGPAGGARGGLGGEGLLLISPTIRPAANSSIICCVTSRLPNARCASYVRTRPLEGRSRLAASEPAAVAWRGLRRPWRQRRRACGVARARLALPASVRSNRPSLRTSSRPTETTRGRSVGSDANTVGRPCGSECVVMRPMGLWYLRHQVRGRVMPAIYTKSEHRHVVAGRGAHRHSRGTIGAGVVSIRRPSTSTTSSGRTRVPPARHGWPLTITREAATSRSATRFEVPLRATSFDSATPIRGIARK